MRLSTWLLIVSLSIGLSACYDNNDDNDSNNTATATSTATASSTATATSTSTATNQVSLSGVVATGKAFQGQVMGTNANGQTASTTIGSNGAYSLTLPLGAPYLLHAIGSGSNAGQNLFSYLNSSTQAATLNITTLTTATMQLAANKTLNELAASFNTWASQRIDPTSIQNAQQALQKNLVNLFAQASLDPASVNVFTSPFQPNGVGLDGVMDLVKEIRFNNGQITMIGQTGQALLLPFDLSGNTTSGTATATSTATATNTATATATSTSVTGDWTLTVSGTVNSSLAGNITIPNIVMKNMPVPAEGDFSSIETSINQQIISQAGVTGQVENLNVKVLKDTASQKTFNVTFKMTANQAGFQIVLDYNLTYDYVR